MIDDSNEKNILLCAQTYQSEEYLYDSVSGVLRGQSYDNTSKQVALNPKLYCVYIKNTINEDEEIIKSEIGFLK